MEKEAFKRKQNSRNIAYVTPTFAISTIGQPSHSHVHPNPHTPTAPNRRQDHAHYRHFAHTT